MTIGFPFDPATLIAGIAVGVVASAVVRAIAPNRQVEWLRSELVQANDRLFAVSREPGALVPPRQEAVAQPESEPLDPQLQSIVDDHEGRGKAVIENVFRRQRQEGISVKECVRRYLDQGIPTS